MRTLLCLLLLSPGLVLAGSYKCMIAGQVTYSEYPCGADARQVPNRLAGVEDAPAKAQSAPGAPNDHKADSSDTPRPTKPATGQLGLDERKADCRARYQQYLDSLACFAPYRTGTRLDPEAFNHCTAAQQPTDCSLDEMK